MLDFEPKMSIPEKQVNDVPPNMGILLFWIMRIKKIERSAGYLGEQTQILHVFTDPNGNVYHSVPTESGVPMSREDTNSYLERLHQIEPSIKYYGILINDRKIDHELYIAKKQAALLQTDIIAGRAIAETPDLRLFQKD
jgi:hypothetical protein